MQAGTMWRRISFGCVIRETQSMPRFTFDIRGADEPFDRVEMDLPDLEAACREAFRACSEMTRDISASTAVQHNWEIEVTDGGNEPVCLIRFSSWHR